MDKDGWTEIGVSLTRVLQELEDEQVRRLVPVSFLHALEEIDPSTGTPQGLRNAVAEVIDLRSTMAAPEHRDLLLSALPGRKRAELEDRAAIERGQLEEADWDADRLRALVGFFGGSYDFQKATDVLPEYKDVEPEYPLFPYQRTAANGVLEVLDDPIAVLPRVLLHMPTGSGKTRTAMHVIARHLKDNDPGVVVWLANSRELLLQASDEFGTAWRVLGNRRVRQTHFWGQIGDLHSPSDGIVIAGLQKLRALLQRDEQRVHQFAASVTLLVVDEAHISVATTYHDVITTLRRSESAGLLGLSATPGRTWNDPTVDRELTDLYGGNKVKLEIEGYDNPVEYLITEGYLARPTFRLLDIEGNPIQADNTRALHPDVEEGEAPSTVGSNAYLLAVVREVRNLVKRHQRILVFAASVEAANNLNLLLRRCGIQSDVVTGETPTGKRASIIRKFRSSDPASRVIVNFGVLTTGFDAPGTSAAVIARPTESLVLYSQMVGRAIRGPLADGNRTAEIVTIVDPNLPGFGSVAAAFNNWEDVW